VLGHLWIVAVYEYDDQQLYPLMQEAIRVSTTIGPALQALDATWRTYDKDNPALASYAPDIAAVKLPAMLIIATGQNGKGKLVQAAPLPPDEESLIAQVKALRGGP